MKYSPHSAFDDIAGLVEGRLPVDARATALSHASGCERCSRVQTQLERTLESMRGDRGEDAPRYARSRALVLLRGRQTPAVSPMRRLLAALFFDSSQQVLGFGVRASGSAERQLLFEAGDCTIHLQVSRAGDVWKVQGQLLGSCARGEVEVRGTNGTVEVRMTNTCEFTLPSLAEGEYVITLRLSESAIELPVIQVGA
jgi:hypothetical protein